jgi:RimJ/RimL family protein N-acetyltransferase
VICVDGALDTARLRLRPWRSGDVDDLSAIFAYEEVWWFPFRRGLTRDETDRFVARKLHEQATRGWTQWAAETRQGRLIGYIGLAPPEYLPEVMPTVEIGWRLDPAFWGRGLATEGASAALAHGFVTLDLPEVVSVCESDNLRSARVMQRLGMHFDHDTRHPTLGWPLRVYRLRRADGRDRAETSEHRDVSG